MALTEEDMELLKKLRALGSSEVPKKLRELRDSSRSIKTLLAVLKELEANVRKKLEAVRATRLMSQVESKLRDAALRVNDCSTLCGAALRRFGLT